jgi:tetratricopeptide (TPR) repeat protein
LAVVLHHDLGWIEEEVTADSVPDNSELPAHSSAYEWLGKLYENENKPNLAAEQYKAALTLDPQNKTLREALKRLPKK